MAEGDLLTEGQMMEIYSSIFSKSMPRPEKTSNIRDIEEGSPLWHATETTTHEPSRGVIDMAESQSRYGIVKDLTDRKTQIQQEISKSEQQLQTVEDSTTNQIADINEKIATEKATFESKFQRWKRTQNMELDIAKQRYEDFCETVEQAIADKEETYVSEHKEGIVRLESSLKQKETELVTSVKTIKNQIKANENIHKELNKAVKDLKDISKEQSKE